ncbi:MAG: hypothetical protein K2Q45_05345 [Nitrosomonas sp.]|nr:hypothetical protein [Nitrosomonas sp.]
MLIGSNMRRECNGQRISGSNLVVVGDNNLVLGYDNEVYGNENTISGDRVKVWGCRNKIKGSCAHIMVGNDNAIEGVDCQIGLGARNMIRLPPIRRVVEAPRPQVHGEYNHERHRPVLTKKRSRENEDEKEVFYVEGPVPTDIVHDKNVPEDASGDQKACIVCLERVPCCVALPCMHLSYCITCAIRLCFGAKGTDLFERGQVKCAECRVSVDAIKRTF